ncbi:hypothetical protein [Sediminispirochaeta bajacaliforniensis]|uniref:hypothetical protein n=1 Tax=Sediminispirochaeta bajacaliforniensis TaxID=148 RepID=UPI000376128E|nr:hypothetical protein [Sediminispirochaeta bajacaliforniensis]
MKQRTNCYVIITIIMFSVWVLGCTTPAEHEGKGEKSAPALPDVSGAKQEVPAIAFSPLTNSEELSAALGVPLSVETEQRANRHNPDVTDLIITYTYDGITFVLQRSGYDGREFLMNVLLTGNGWTIPEGVSVGNDRGDLLRSFGESNRVEDDRVIYERPASLGSSAMVRYTFVFSGERISSIEISTFPL